MTATATKKTCRRRAAAAPPLQPWIGRSPMADGKSTNLEPEGPPPCDAAIVFELDLHTCSFQTINNRSRRPRAPAREEGARHLRRDASTRKEAEKRPGSAEPHHPRRPPPPQTTPTAPSSPRRSQRATHSNLAIYRREPWFPHPPAAGAAGGGGEPGGTPPANWIRRG